MKGNNFLLWLSLTSGFLKFSKKNPKIWTFEVFQIPLSTALAVTPPHRFRSNLMRVCNRPNRNEKVAPGQKSIYHENQSLNFQIAVSYTPAIDCSISFRLFGTELTAWHPVQGQVSLCVSKVKITAWKRWLIAKLLRSFRKSWSLDLMAMSESWKPWNRCLCACAVGLHIQPQTAQNDWRVVGPPPVALHLESPFLVSNFSSKQMQSLDFQYLHIYFVH